MYVIKYKKYRERPVIGSTFKITSSIVPNSSKYSCRVPNKREREGGRETEGAGGR